MSGRPGGWRPAPRALLLAGTAGSVLVAVSSLWVGATPLVFRTDPPAVIDLLPQGAPVALVAWYVGIAAMVLAWLGFGRAQWRGDPPPWRTLRAAGLAQAVPMLFAAPAMSRDLWAYVAQARIAAAGLDPYAVSPLRFGGPTLANVSARWVDSPSPYGPLWTLLGRGLDAVAGDHAAWQVFVLRLPAAVGFGLLAWVVPALARRVGSDPGRACWALVANPAVVLHGVGGGHNDTLVVGLLAAGLLVTVAGGPRWRALVVGGLLVGAAAAIKIPAVVAAPFLPLLQAWFAPGRPRWGPLGWRAAIRTRARDVVTGTVTALLAAVAALALASLAAGHGLVWIAAANTPEHGGGPVTTTVLLLVLVALWLRAVADTPLALLAAALLAPALIAETVQPWYLFWALVPAAVVLRGRWGPFAVAVVTVTAIVDIRPNGPNFAVGPGSVVLLVVLAAAAVLVWLVLDRHWRPWRPGRPAADVVRPVSRSSRT